MLSALAIIGSVASIIGLYALYQARVNNRIKRLHFESTRGMPLVSAASVKDYKLSIIYERSDEKPEVIHAAYVSYARFANFGREPIRAADIAPGNPLRVKAQLEDKGRVLDISVQGARDVNNVQVGPVFGFPGHAQSYVTFDFLDYNDGCVLRLLSTDRPEKLELIGDIIGMPQGIEVCAGRERRKLMDRVGNALIIAGELLCLTALAFLYRRVTGGWDDIWLLVLVPIALILPLIIAAAVATSARFTGHPRFPPALEWPGLPFTLSRSMTSSS